MSGVTDMHLRNEMRQRGIQFVVGRTASGKWIVRGNNGPVGEAFPDRASAVRFAIDESGGTPASVYCVQVESAVSATSLPRTDRSA
jgi:hypothetical protein